MKRRVGVFTGTRADYGLLRPVLRHLVSMQDCELFLYVSGSHLSRAHGYTLDEILDDGFTPTALVDMDLQGDNAPSVCRSMGLALTQMSDALVKHVPDILILLGDRYEVFAAAGAATVCTVPLAHIHGGEVTVGAMDEAFRHGITKMSHLHFTSCEAYRQRVIQLGECPQRVWNVGALGVENAITLELWGEYAIRTHLGIEPTRPYFLCTFHPVTLERDAETAHWREVQRSLDAFPEYAVIATGANADLGGNSINKFLAQWACSQPSRVRVIDSLGVVRYLSAAKFAACVVGNSSSGVLEVPSLGTPVVDIGNRQKGRTRSASVLHCETSCEAIVAALRQALTPAYRALAGRAPNPYQGKETSHHIARIVCQHPLKGILTKPFYDLQGRA